MIVNGKALAEDILRSVRTEVADLPHAPVVRAVVMQPSAATESYLRIKEKRSREAGMSLDIVRLDTDNTTEDVINSMLLPGADSVIVQLPLPPHIDTDRVLNAIPVELDADVLSEDARTQFEHHASDALLPPVVAAIREILKAAHVEVQGKRAVVLGQGWLVGEPAALWLRAEGADVTVVTRDSENLDVLREAEIIVSGAGSAGLIHPEHLTPGVVLIDAGTSESDGAIVGDALPECAEIASVFTPVPGGVGPVAVACLFKNAALLAQRNNLQTGSKAV